MNESEYKFTDEDILIMIRRLRITLPQYATPDKAIFLLKQKKVHYEKLEELYPEIIDKTLKDFEEH